jgi:hypothetical protein
MILTIRLTLLVPQMFWYPPLEQTTDIVHKGKSKGKRDGVGMDKVGTERAGSEKVGSEE